VVYDDKTVNRRQARWSLFLSEFDFTIRHRAGSLSQKPDALSRRRDFCTDSGLVHDRPVLPSSLFINAMTLSPSVPEKIAVDSNVVELVTDPVRQLSILSFCHDSPLAGHFGIHKTFDLVSRNFTWPGMREMVKSFVPSCDVCARSKVPRRKPAGLLHPLPVASQPWSSISMDFIVKLPKSTGLDSILVVVDRYSNMAHFIPCNETINSPQLAKIVFANVFKFHALPIDIVSDRCPQFVSQF